MNSTATTKAIESHDALISRADEQLAHAHEQIVRADEQLARMSEQVAKLERDAARPPSAGPGPQSPPGRPALRALVGLLLAACIIVAALVLQSPYGARAKLVVARWAPQLASASPPQNLPPPAQPALSAVEVAGAEATPPQATLIAQTAPQATPVAQTAPQATPVAQTAPQAAPVAQTAPQAAPVAQTAPQDATPTAPAALPDNTQLLQTMAQDLANLQQNIEQLKANQQQMARDSSKAIGELKASQEEIKRALTKVSEQNLPKTSPPPTQPASTVRKPERTLQLPPPKPRPRMPREWIYDEW
jgi:hypothetical protein